VLDLGIFVASHKAEFSLAYRDYDVAATVDAFEYDAEIVAADTRTVV
jgi:hypothetical protein